MGSDIKTVLNEMINSVDLTPHHNYWMIRSEGGKHYQPFLQKGIVALRMPYITASYATSICNNELPVKMVIDEIKAHLENISKDSKMLIYDWVKELQTPNVRGNRASQLYTFVKTIQHGDIVLVPSEGTSYISIGMVIGNELLTDDRINKSYPLCRKVKWLNQIPKYRLDPGIYRALSAHQAISNLSDYEEYIERSFNSCFIKDGVCNYVLTLNSADINAENFFRLGSDVLEILTILKEKYDIDVDINDINLSMNLNSPGKVVFKSRTAIIAFLMMALFSACSDGQVGYEQDSAVQGEAFTTLVDSLRTETGGNIDVLKSRINQCLHSTEAKALEKWNKESLNER